MDIKLKEKLAKLAIFLEQEELAISVLFGHLCVGDLLGRCQTLMTQRTRVDSETLFDVIEEMGNDLL